MALIDKDQVKAEIERRLSLIYLLEGDFTDGSRDAYEGLLSWLDIYPEQPASDGLEEEISRYLREKCSSDDEPSVSEIARHFYELGKNARKEE